MAGEELKFPIGVPVETNADEAAASVEDLRDQIMSSTESIRAMSGTLRQLRGTSDAVKAAKEKLTAQLGVEKDRVSAASLALVKQGTTYDAAAQKSKKYTLEQKKLAESLKKDELAKTKDRADAMSSAISKAGGPVAMLRDKLQALKAVTGESSGAMGLVTLAAAGTIAAIVALTAAAGVAAVSLGKFILSSVNAARSANLAREAWSGTAQNAANLGTQIDALANKVPTSKAALNELAIALMKSKLGGQATVDAFAAVAQASSALGDEAGGKIKEFIERGRLMGRMRIDPSEMLEGFGNLNFDDVARSLAAGMNVSVSAAKKALREGRVKLGDGAAAMKDAVEKKFGDLNLRKMLDLNVMSEKLHEKLAGLTKGVSLEPLLKPMGELGKLFDDTTVTGQMLKKLVTEFGGGMVTGLTKAIPLAKSLLEGLVIGSLRAYIGFLQLRNAIRKTFGDSDTLKNIDLLKFTLESAKGPGIALAKAFEGIARAIETFDKIKNFDPKKWGGSIIDGVVDGMTAGQPKLTKSTQGLADQIKKDFKGSLEINSPSKAFFRFGEATPEGYAGGVKRGTPKAQAAVEDMVDMPSSPRSSSGGGGGGGRAPIVLHLHFEGAAGGASQTSRELSEPSFLLKVTKAVEQALITAGVPAMVST